MAFRLNGSKKLTFLIDMRLDVPVSVLVAGLFLFWGFVGYVLNAIEMHL